MCSTRQLAACGTGGAQWSTHVPCRPRSRPSTAGRLPWCARTKSGRPPPPAATGMEGQSGARVEPSAFLEPGTQRRLRRQACRGAGGASQRKAAWPPHPAAEPARGRRLLRPAARQCMWGPPRVPEHARRRKPAAHLVKRGAGVGSDGGGGGQRHQVDGAGPALPVQVLRIGVLGRKAAGGCRGKHAEGAEAAGPRQAEVQARRARRLPGRCPLLRPGSPCPSTGLRQGCGRREGDASAAAGRGACVHPGRPRRAAHQAAAGLQRSGCGAPPCPP